MHSTDCHRPAADNLKRYKQTCLTAATCWATARRPVLLRHITSVSRRTSVGQYLRTAEPNSVPALQHRAEINEYKERTNLGLQRSMQRLPRCRDRAAQSHKNVHSQACAIKRQHASTACLATNTLNIFLQNTTHCCSLLEYNTLATHGCTEGTQGTTAHAHARMHKCAWSVLIHHSRATHATGSTSAQATSCGCASWGHEAWTGQPLHSTSRLSRLLPYYTPRPRRHHATSAGA